MNSPDQLVPGSEEIALRIVVLRGQRVLLDADLARIYGVSTGRLNEQVKRNLRRFPEDFFFQLTLEEAEQVARSRSQNAILKRGQNIKYRPYAFTEHGAIQAANVLNSEAAVVMGVHVVRAFVRLRQWLSTQAAFAAKLEELEARVGEHDEQLAAVIAALRQLAASPEPQRPQDGILSRHPLIHAMHHHGFPIGFADRRGVARDARGCTTVRRCQTGKPCMHRSSEVVRRAVAGRTDRPRAHENQQNFSPVPPCVTHRLLRSRQFAARS